MSLVMYPNVGQRSSRPRMSLSPRGLITFNNGADRCFGLNKYKFCILYYDTDEKKIVIELTNDEKNPASLNLRKKITGGLEISSKCFFNFFNIVVSEHIICDIKAGEKEKTLVADLKESTVWKRRKNSKRD